MLRFMKLEHCINLMYMPHNRYRNGYKRVRYGFFFMPIFTPKQGDFPNFATHLLQVLPSCCGFEICTEYLIPTCCAFNSLNNRYSLSS